VTEPKRPLLRYYGGKWRLSPWIISQFPPHRIYVEPFGGGGSVLLRKPKSYGEIYNDLDQRVVNVFRVLQNRMAAEELERRLRVTPFSRDEMELSYERSRYPIEDARRTIIASFMGFGSDSVTRSSRTGFRSNSNRSGTTPAHDWATWPNQIQAFTERLSGVVIENRDAREVMLSQDSPETLHYVDPPYVMDSRADARHGYRFEMADSDHEELLTFLAGLQGFVVISAYEHPIYQRLETLGWQKSNQETLVMQNRTGVEALWMNPAAAGSQRQLKML
jgi:DNA adenine methylase